MLVRARRIRVTRIDFADILRACSLLLLILMAIMFFAACANNPGAEPDAAVRKRDGKVEAYGEVGAGYGRRM